MDRTSNLMTGIRGPIRGDPRRGTIIVLAAVLMVFLVGILAFTVDVGYMCMARGQAQACADAAALAAALEMTSNENLKLDVTARTDAATQKALDCAALQDINHSLKATAANEAPSVIESVTFGRLENPDNPNEGISFLDPNNPNVVIVQVTCDPASNTAIPLFFARIFGVDSARTTVSAVAAFSSDRTTGFDKKNDDLPCTLMPFVISDDEWKDFLASGGEDNWSYDPETKTVSPGADGIPELAIYPETQAEDTGMIAPGNFGTVNIGEYTSNSANKLRDQIVSGPSAEDMAAYDGILRLDPVTNNFELTGAANLELNADPGVTASIKQALGQVIGHPKSIMLFSDVVGGGNNAQFTISGFAGVRIVDYDMQGSARTRKYVLIQPAMVQDSAVVADGDSQTSDFVGQPVHLVR